MQKPEECIFYSTIRKKGTFPKLFSIKKPSIYAGFGDLENKMKKS